MKLHLLATIPLALGITILTTTPSLANGAILQCGTVSHYSVNTDPNTNFCDIYSRQFAYRNASIALREQIKARSENFIAPQIEARKNYRAQLKALHDKNNPALKQANASIKLEDKEAME